MTGEAIDTTTKIMSDITLKGPGPATLALHADDSVNVVSDVAPPMHLSTTYRYSDNPDELIAWADAEVHIKLP